MQEVEAANQAPDSLALPDALGDRGRAELGARQLLHLQQQQRELENLVLIDELDEDDIVPRVLVNGETITVGGQRARLESAQWRLVDAHEDIRDEFDSACARLRERVGGG